MLLWRFRRFLISFIVSSGIWSIRYWPAFVFSDDGTEYSIVGIEDSCDNNPFFNPAKSDYSLITDKLNNAFGESPSCLNRYPTSMAAQ